MHINIPNINSWVSDILHTPASDAREHGVLISQFKAMSPYVENH